MTRAGTARMAKKSETAENAGFTAVFSEFILKEVPYMYAIIATGGKQYKVSEGDVVEVEKLPNEVGEKVTFDQVLAVRGDSLKVGEEIKGAKVEGTIVSQKRAKKIPVYHYKNKSGYHKKYGHRQPYTRVKIDSIVA